MARQGTALPKVRRFNGKRFTLQESHATKSKATAAAENDYRRKGRPARVVRRATFGGRILYGVYVHFG